jgi:FkbM family methyltransferase
LSWISQLAIEQLARRGLVVRRHPAVRRQALLRRHGVDLVFDVGAATGLYARELRQFGYTGRIVSFEPLAEPYGVLAAAAGGDPSWQTHRCALGAKAATTTTHVASNSDSSSLLPMARAHVDAAPHVGYIREEAVEVCRLDDLAHDHAGSRAFLKLDTQGFERDVLQGAVETLDRCVGLQIELSFVPLYEGGPLIDEMIGFAYQEGFRMVAVDPGFSDPRGELLQADAVFFRTIGAEGH